jgi:hypothetical protein
MECAMRQPKALPQDIEVALIAGSRLIEAASELAVAMSPRSLVNRTDLRKRLSPDRTASLRNELTKQLATALKSIGPLAAEVAEYKADCVDFGGVRESSFSHCVLRASVAVAASGATNETLDELKRDAFHFLHQFYNEEPEFTAPGSSADWHWLERGFDDELRDLAARRMPNASGTCETDDGATRTPADNGGYLGGSALAEALKIDPARHGAFAKQLERKRRNFDKEDWTETLKQGPNSPTFLYRLNSVKLRALAAKYKAPE